MSQGYDGGDAFEDGAAVTALGAARGARAAAAGARFARASAAGPRSHDRAPGRGGRADDRDVLADLAWLPGNDTGNGWRFIARFGGDFLSVRGLGWLAWNGRIWDRAEGERLAQIAAQEVARLIAGESDHLAQIDGEDVKDWEARKRARRAWGRDSGNSGRIRGMLEQAAVHLNRSIEEMDPDPRRIAVLNGTLDLLPPPADRAGVELEFLHRFEAGHRREHMITRLAPVIYRPEADAPKWQAFLNDVQPERIVQDYLARLAGYGLTGFTTEEKLFVFEGKGRNGKGVFVDVLQMVLGDMAQPFAIETLLADDRRSGASASPDVAKLRGARMAFTGEPKRGSLLDDGRIKSFTGGDAIQARDMYEKPFEFRPTFKIVISWNTRPSIGSDDGIWARLEVLPWKTQILNRLPDGAPNPKWRPKNELLGDIQAELSGVLNWMLRGYGDWAMQRMAPPEIVRETVKSYRDEFDHVGAFLADCCTIEGEDVSTAMAKVETAYHNWCRRNSLKAISTKALGVAMSERGFQNERKGGGYAFRRGVDVRAEWLHFSDDREPMP